VEGVWKLMWKPIWGVEIVGVGLLEVALELWVGFIGWWARGDLNPGPPPCEGGVLSRLDDGPPVR
jgi:hypothetical protein